MSQHLGHPSSVPGSMARGFDVLLASTGGHPAPLLAVILFLLLSLKSVPEGGPHHPGVLALR